MTVIGIDHRRLLPRFEASVQAHLDATAQERTYSDTQALASYLLSENAMRRTEARAFLSWRDSVWEYARPELQKMRDGERPTPSIDDFLTELPAFEWPSEPEGIRHTEFHTGVTDANGQVTITFSEPFGAVPHVSPEMLPVPDAFTFMGVTAVSESGATVTVRRRRGLEVLGLTLLSAATTPVAGVNVSIQATGV